MYTYRDPALHGITARHGTDREYLPKGDYMHRTPRHYQVEGIDWLTQPNVSLHKLDLSTHTLINTSSLCRHLLTDAPGAGKSFTSTEAALQLMQPHNATCIITPAHLVQQWFDFLCEQYPDDAVISLEGTKSQKQKDANLPARWYIVSTQSLRRPDHYDLLVRLYIDHRVSCTIIDESHYVKNPDAKTSHNIRKLTRPDFCPHVILLSATPIMKEASDLFHQLRIIDPHQFSAMSTFLNEYCYYSWTSWGPADVTLRKDTPEKLSPYLMGRTYAQIGLELPPLVSHPPHVHSMIPQRRKAYDDIKKYWATLCSAANGTDEPVSLNANNAMEVMHMLRHVISSPEKQQALAAYLQDDPGPYLVAAFYRDSAKELKSYIQHHHPEYNPIVITGELDPEHRIALARAATKPNDIIIATIPSISEGCDLSHCNTVYFYEEDWSPGKHYQFLSRVRRHRDNQGVGVTITEDNHLHVDVDPNERPVIVRFFHAEKSIDQRIHAVRDQRAVNVKDLIKVELGE